MAGKIVGKADDLSITDSRAPVRLRAQPGAKVVQSLGSTTSVKQSLMIQPPRVLPNTCTLKMRLEHISVDDLDLGSVGYREQVMLDKQLLYVSLVSLVYIFYPAILSFLRVAQERDGVP